jgi:hypothetical protein
MSISNVQSALPSIDVQPIKPAATQTASAADAAAATSGVTVDISKPGQLFSQLSSLAQSDPDKFKAVAASIASKLNDAASSETGHKADFLKGLADRFTAASQSGDASGLAPKAAGHGHHRGHHAHAAAGGDTGAVPATAGTNDSIAQQVQGIIAGALDTTTG